MPAFAIATEGERGDTGVPRDASVDVEDARREAGADADAQSSSDAGNDSESDRCVFSTNRR